MPTVVVLGEPTHGTTLQIDKGTTVSVVGGANLGAGTGIYSSVSGALLQFKSLVAGAGISLSNDSNTVTLTNTISAFTLSNGNGTTASGSAVNLGGNLSSSSLLNITNNTTSFQIQTSLSGSSYFSFNRYTNTSAISVVSTDTTNAAKYAGIRFDIDNAYGNGSGVYFQDARTVTKGLEYLSDYSSGYTTRSLVDKGYVSGATYLTGAISAIALSNLTINRALVSSGAGKIIASSVTDTELAQLVGVSGNIQTQLNGKQATVSGTIPTIISGPGLYMKVLSIGDWDMSTATGTGTINVPHGLSNHKKIRSITGIIRDDGDTIYSTLPSFGSIATIEAWFGDGGSTTGIDATNIKISRLAGGTYDGAAYNATSYNRGWLTLIYEV